VTAPPAPYEKPRSGNARTFVIVAAVVVGVCVGGALTCAGACAGLFVFGGDMLAGQVRTEVEAALEPHVGTLQDFELNWTESGLYEEPDVMVYDVQGSTGSGRLVVDHVSVDAETEEVRWAVLHPAGDAAPLVLMGDPPPKFLER